MPRSKSLSDVDPSDLPALLNLIAQLDSPFVLLREPEVEQITHTSVAGRHFMRKRGEFPDPILIGQRAVAWRGSDIAAWLHSREPSKIASSEPEQLHQPAQPHARSSMSAPRRAVTKGRAAVEAV
jgi:prophage regulatory protein